jgi:hypothetical protein
MGLCECATLSTVCCWTRISRILIRLYGTVKCRSVSHQFMAELRGYLYDSHSAGPSALALRATPWLFFTVLDTRDRLTLASGRRFWHWIIWLDHQRFGKFIYRFWRSSHRSQLDHTIHTHYPSANWEWVHCKSDQGRGWRQLYGNHRGTMFRAFE